MQKIVVNSLMFILLLGGCSSGGLTQGNLVDVKKLEANITQTNSINQGLQRKNQQLKVDSAYEQDIVIYNEESELTLTVLLDNPKADSIDALEISSSDEESLIIVDGSYKKIQVSGTKRILNWAQEDPYEKVFYIQVFQVDKPILIEVTDIKVNGAWQGQALSNAKMQIHKLSEAVFSFEFLYNTFDEYRFKFNTNDLIQNLTITGATLNEDGSYSVLNEGLVSWNFDYEYEGKLIRRTEGKDIEFLKVVETYNYYQILVDSIRLMAGYDEASIKSFKRTLSFDWMTPRFWIKIVGGTDVDKESFQVSFDNKNPLTFEQGKNETPGFDFMPGLSTNYSFTSATLLIGGFSYVYSDTELKMPLNVEPGDNSNFDLA